MTDRGAPAAVAEGTVRIAIGSSTHVGGRTTNEDSIDVQTLPPITVGDQESEGHLMILADGMGGYLKGEVASRMAVETVREMFEEDPAGDAVPLLKQAFRRANERIYSNSQGGSSPQMMGTTLVVAATRGKYATIASIGDSRAYLVRAGRLNPITRDHSLVADQVEMGQITAEEARESPHRNILTHALGHKAKLDAKMPSVFELTLLPEDRLFLCTDGFYDVVSEDDMLAALLAGPPSESAPALVELAVSRGSSDNVSAIVAGAEAARPRVPALAQRTDVATRRIPPEVLAIAGIVLLAVIGLLLFLLVL